MAYERRDFAGAAPETRLVADITTGSTSFSVDDATGHPTGTNGPFVETLDLNGATEEKVLCSGRTGNTFTVATGGRGFDGTTAASHNSGTTVNHTISKRDADEANYTVAQTVGKVTTKGDLLPASGPNAFDRLAVGAAGRVLQPDAAAPGGMSWSDLLRLADATTIPTANPADGFVVYSEGDVFRIRDAEGVKTPIGREFFDGKGELLVGLADNAFDNLAAPSTGKVLTGNTAATLGVEWANAAFGTLGYAEVTANQGGITSETDLTGLSVTVTVAANRRVRITAKTECASNNANDVAAFRIKEGASTLEERTGPVMPLANVSVGVDTSVAVTPSAGAHTYKLSLARAVGAGTLTMSAFATRKAYILVEDIGTA